MNCEDRLRPSKSAAGSASSTIVRTSANLKKKDCRFGRRLGEPHYEIWLFDAWRCATAAQWGLIGDQESSNSTTAGSETKMGEQKVSAKALERNRVISSSRGPDTVA